MYDEKAAKKFLTQESKVRIAGMATTLEGTQNWTIQAIEDAVNGFCESSDIKLKHVAQPSRVALTGEATGPGLFEMMVVLGRVSVLNRLRRACGDE